VIDVQFLEIGEHVNSDRLRTKIQEAIDRSEHATHEYDAVLLGFGLCGNSINGIRAGKCPLVVPRAHDCCTILLGDRKEFERRFRDRPSTPFSSTGYLERSEYFIRGENGELRFTTEFQALVDQYGEENARYIWDTMYAKAEQSEVAVFIDIPETASLNAFEKFEEKAMREGKRIERLPGSLAILRNLTDGNWDDDAFLVVKPGETIQGVYDWDLVIRACAACAAVPPSPPPAFGETRIEQGAR
jgi:hypothetical protein